ncbi:cubilin-like isoform X2 [Asterias rubens]|uniref:cubilin-like isoform X2 n=1 Tax=Asterias rubens TaxID=7604 RepID=UPI0014554E95|nr:cubilin-like isoform X2 [Asterias rubens]
MWTKILTFCVVLLLYGGRVRGSEDGTPGDQTRALQFLRNVLSKDSQQSQIFKKLALGRSRRDAEKECGGTVQVEVGSFQSPGFPRGYAQDLLCVWTIQAPASKQVLLRFMSFDVKGGSRGVCNPGEDYVMMRDGSRTGKNLGIFCNALMSESPLPSAILSVTNEVWIIFHTNRRDEGKGFLLSIQAVTSVKFSDYIADQITFEPSTEAESSSAGRPSTEVIETTKAPTTLLRRLSVNPATTFPFTQESDQLTIAPGDKFSFESVAIGNPQLGTSFFGNSMGSFVGYTNPPPSDTPTTVTDLITHPDLTQTLPKDTTDSRSQPQSTSQLQTVSSTDGVTSHHELQTGQPIMQSKEQSTVLTKSFGVTNKQQEATETELLPVAQTELKFLTGTEQIYLLQSDEESVSLPDLQQATGVTLLPVTEPEQYTVTQVRDVSDAKQPSVSNTDSVTKSWQQFVTQIEELPVTEVKQEPLTKPDELQPSTRSLPTEQETITLTKQLLSTSNLIPTTQPGPQIVTQTGELTNLNGLQELTSSWQQIISQTVKLQTHAKQQPVTKSNGPQLVTMLLKEITVPTIQPSVSEIDNQEPGIQTGKQVGTESYKTQSLTMAKTDVQQPVTPAEQLLTEIYELQPVTMRRQQSDSPTGPLDPLTDKPQYLTEPDESWIRTEQDIATQTDAGDIGTQQPTEMFTYQEQGSTAEYQPISTTEVIVSNEPKETISQQHLPSSAKSASTTEQHLDVKTQWQALTTEQRRPTTDPEADRQVTVPPSVPPTLPPPPPSLPPLLPTLPRLTPLLPSPPPPFSFPDITPEPGFPSKEFDHPLTQSLSQVFNTLVNVNLHDRKSIIQACQNLNETMNETLESFKSLPRLVQGLEYTKSLLTASLPVEMLSVNFSGDAALDNPQLFQFLLIQSLEDGVSEIITQASQFLNYTIQNVSRIQSDIPEASCIRGYSQQLLNALQRDTSITGSLALVNEVFNDLFGVNITKKLPPRVDDYQPDLAPDEEPWDFNQVITNPSGELQSPNYPDAYPMGVRYRWNITARPHGLISLNFTHFDLDSALIDNQCDSRYAHITVVDGSGLETERKHVYCGQEVPEQIVSSSNLLIVMFISSYGYGTGFHADFAMHKLGDFGGYQYSKTVVPDRVCGGVLTQRRGSIKSPNYPGDFETSVDCQWIVTVEAGLTISLNFTDLNLDSFPVDNWCSESYTHVKVIDGIHGSSHVFCGQEVPPLFISSTNTLTVTFVSMYGYGGRFHAVYTALLQDRIKPTESVCGGNFNKTRGVIQLPDHLEGEFEMGLRCQWNITVDITEVISFIFTEFNLDSLPIDDKCNEGYAHVKVVEGSGKSNIYCGQEIPLSFITTTNTLLVVFDSSYGYSDRFRAVYRAYQVYDSGSGDPKLGIEPSSMSVTEPLCGGSFNQPSGSIQLPEQTSDNCRWNITVESGWIILLTFTTFDIDSYTVDGQCDENYAHVKVTDQQSSNIFCGQNVPPQVTSRSRTLIVDYVGVYGYGEGFEASYVIRDADFATLEASQVTDAVSSPSASTQAQILTDETLYQCGEDLNLPYGTIQSPSYLGDQATGGRTCRWTITVGDNLLIQLAFTDFNLDSMAINGECDQRYDYLKIVDGETQVGSSEFVYCGQDIPNIYVSSSNDLIVIFYTSYGYSGGFTAEYKVVEPDKILPNTFSPSTSKSTQAHLTDESSYKCGGDLNLPYGTIQSPSYSGDQATGGRTCRWTITVGDNLLIQLAFTDFNLDSMSINGECDQRYDYLKIVDGETKEFLYCGQDIPNIYVSSSNYLIVIFYTSYGYSGGFTAEYSVMEPDSILTNTLSPSTSKLPSAVEPHECGGDISTPTGEIKSPNPGDYTTGVNCVWKITLDASSKVVLRFTVFNVDSMPVDNECDTRYAHVLVVDGSSEETSPKHVYCGQDLPEDFVSTSNSLIIAFISQYGYGGRFKAGYSPLELEDDYLILLPSTSIPSILGCGGILDSPDGVIQSPDLSTMERTQSINCKWYIELQEAGTITIVFEYFDLDSVLFENGCEEMYANLKIIDTSTGVSQVYCGQEVPPSFVASTNELLIVFSGLYGFSRGFRAEYHSTQPLLSVDPTTVSVLPTSVSAVESQLPACGSILREDYAEFSTPGYPNLYPFNTICSWHIFVDSTHFIALKFLDFDIDNPMVQPDCSIHYSYVRVSYQGESGIQETHLLCGSELPEILKMRTHSAVVYFKSNLGMGQGFKASYQAYSQSSSDVWATAIPPATVSVISPLVLIAQSGQILSPNYPVQFPHNVDKLWIIRPARQTFITLIFEDIDFDAITGESGQCNTLYTNVALTTFNIDRGYSEFLICSNQMTTAVYSYGELKLAFHSTYGIGRGFRATYSSDIRFGDFGFVTEEPDTPTPIQSQSTYKEYVMNTRNPIVEITDGCLYTLTQSRGHFSSPDYPSMYPQEVVCQWIMLAPSGWLVRLDFSQFLLDSDDSPPCDTKYSHLVITTSDAYGGRDYTYCGQQLPPRIISPTNRLVVTFRSMFGIDFGFVAAYQFISAETYQGSFGPVFIDRDGNTGHGSDAEKTTSPMSSQEEDSAARVTEGSLIGDTPCERVFSNPEGVIRSPYFPQGMPQGEECTWTITVPGEKGIHLSFLDFYLDDYEVDTSTCSEDSASVSVLMDGSLYEFCGNVPPSPLISTGNSIIVELKTMSGNGPGFRMHFIDASLVSADSVTSHKTGDITESGTSGVDFRFLGDDGMTVPPNGDKRDFTQPDRERVNVPVPQSDDPSAITASTPVSGVEDEVGSTGTINTTTVNKDNMETLSGYTSVAKTTGTASTADAGDVLTSHQLRVTAIVCGSVSFILFFLLILLTTICIYKRRRRHSSKTVNMGQSEKNYWQNYKSWAREYTGGPNKLEVADEEGVEAVPIPEQERLV